MLARDERLRERGFARVRAGDELVHERLALEQPHDLAKCRFEILVVLDIAADLAH